MRVEELREGSLSVGGVRSPLIEAGPGDSAEAVVFVHGNPGSREDWVDLVGRAGTLGRAVAFDMPGFGQADKPAGFDYSVPGYARFIQGALDELGIDWVHLVIHDTGGWFGHAWAGEHPEAFRTAVITNTPPISGYRWYPLAKGWRTPILGELLNATATRWFFGWNVRRGGGRPVPVTFVDRMWRDYDAGTRHAILKLYRATDARRFVPTPVLRFREMDRPALVVWGCKDIYIPIPFAHDHRNSFPRAEFVFLRESGHWPYIDDPTGFARAMMPFLERHVGSKGA